eukprot:1657210-Rhodomonas_salina.1
MVVDLIHEYPLKKGMREPSSVPDPDKDSILKRENKSKLRSLPLSSEGQIKAVFGPPGVALHR